MKSDSLTRIPPVGSAEFRKLDFKDQLVVVSLKIFEPERYDELAGIKPEFAPSLWLDLPPLPDIKPLVQDLPVAFLHRYWAAYSSAFREQDYFVVDGTSPLDYFGMEARRLVNVWGFNFSLLSLNTPLYYISNWISYHHFNDTYEPTALLIACKVYVYLEMCLPHLSFCKTPNLVLESALNYFNRYRVRTFDELNNLYPIIEECEDLAAFEYGDFVTYHPARPAAGRWFWPLIPIAMWHAPRFRVFGWGWLRKET